MSNAKGFAFANKPNNLNINMDQIVAIYLYFMQDILIILSMEFCIFHTKIIVIIMALLNFLPKRWSMDPKICMISNNSNSKHWFLNCKILEISA